MQDITYSFYIDCCYGAKCKRWGAVSPDLPGLVAEEDTLDELMIECWRVVKELLEDENIITDRITLIPRIVRVNEND